MSHRSPRTDTRYDVVIIGAGVSGIGAAYHLQTRAPQESYVILEARATIGGTWDLFRYPGIRSDSDMYTFGFTFKPWVYEKALSPGSTIKNYLTEAASDHGIDQQIQFSSRVTHASWCTKSRQWTLKVTDSRNGEYRTVTCRFIISCGGYYNYERGYEPEIEGMNTFKGKVIHPQYWPQDFDYADRRIVVIGSGATAVTLVPSLAGKAAHVTMLQRSPTYIVSRPSVDKTAAWLQRVLPEAVAFSLVRWRNILAGIAVYSLSRRFPRLIKSMLVRKLEKEIGETIDVKKHFTPAYNPWDQRICLVPDGDLFDALKKGQASVVTDTIERVTTRGILLRSGKHLDADTIVTATGLRVEVFSGITVTVDGNTVDPGNTHCYRGMMLSTLPNLAFSVGYTNASWTLKSELVAAFACRILNHMRKHKFDVCVPCVPDDGLAEEPLMDFNANYILRARQQMPKQGSRAPWKLYQNYILDRLSLGAGKLDDGALTFSQRSGGDVD